MPTRSEIRSSIPVLGVSIAQVIVFLTVLSIPLAAGQSMGLSSGEISSWIMVIYGIPGILGIVLTFRFRQPIPLTGTLLAIIFVASIRTRLTYAETVGAFTLAGPLVAVIGAFGLTVHLARLIPAPIVWGLFAGVTLPFIINIFAPLGDHTFMIASTLLVYFAARCILGPHPIVIVPALVTGLIAAGISGELGSIPLNGAFPTLVLTAPSFTIRALLSVTRS